MNSVSFYRHSKKREKDDTTELTRAESRPGSVTNLRTPRVIIIESPTARVYRLGIPAMLG